MRRQKSNMYNFTIALVCFLYIISNLCSQLQATSSHIGHTHIIESAGTRANPVFHWHQPLVSAHQANRAHYHTTTGHTGYGPTPLVSATPNVATFPHSSSNHFNHNHLVHGHNHIHHALLSGPMPPMRPSPLGHYTAETTSRFDTFAPVASTSASAFTPATSPSSTSAPTSFNLTELCTNANIINTEKQLLAYVSSIEAVTGTIQELDEVVQQLKPRSCEQLNVQRFAAAAAPTTQAPGLQTFTSSSSSPLERTEAAAAAPTTTATSLLTPELHHGNFMETTFTPEATNTPSFSDETVATTVSGINSNIVTESFFDQQQPSTATSQAQLATTSATVNPNERFIERSKRQSAVNVLNESTTMLSVARFGMPAASMEQADELAKASNDLRSLRKDLTSTAEWLRQTNHTVHSALLRALVTYVSSIERRIDSQRQVYVAQARMAALKSKIAIVREKMAALLEKLKSIIPHKNNNNNAGGGGGAGDAGNGGTGGATTIANNRADRQPIVLMNSTPIVSFPSDPLPMVTSTTSSTPPTIFSSPATTTTTN